MAQDVSIKSFVGNTTISSEDQFQYSVELSGNSMNLPDVSFPDLNDFYVLGGPNQSTSIQFVNGKQSSSKTFSYYLKPKSVGTLKIGKASVTVNGNVIYSNEIILTVTKSSSPPASNQQSATTDNSVLSKDLFLKSFVSKTKAYIGEQIIIEYKLYFKNQVNGYDIEQLPAATGFWKEEFEIPQRPQIDKEVINGVAYNTATLKKIAVFPTRVGQLSIEPMAIKVEVILPNKRSKRQSLFDSFFESRGQAVSQVAKSSTITLNISELPEKGKPLGFSGAVGSFNFAVDVDKKSADVNEAISLKMNLSGTGNLKLANLPLIDIPPDIEQYDPKIQSSLTKTGNNIGGSKQAEYILIPRVPGDFRIKPINFSYFDPGKNRYFTKSSGEINFKISGEAVAGTGSPMAGFSRREVTLLGSDVRFIKENTLLSHISERSSSFSNFLVSGFVIGIFLFSGFLLYDDHKAKIEGNKVLARSRYASKLAAKLLADAKSNLNSDNASGFYKSVNAALSRFVQDKLNIELADFNVQTARSSLRGKELPEDLVNQYIALTQDCDFKQFSGTNSSLADKQTTMEQARRLITDMEKYI